MNYQDPENIDEIMERLKTLPTLKEVKELIEEIFPNWMVAFIPRYSYDYEFFQKNWFKICQIGNISPTEILIIDDMIFDENHYLIRTFAELLSRSGFSVRRKQEFFPCYKCGLALPTKDLYNMIEERSVVPDVWSSKCKNC